MKKYFKQLLPVEKVDPTHVSIPWYPVKDKAKSEEAKEVIDENGNALKGKK
ncbi:MAG: hypothetical protein AB7I18_02705 [Candidatus Berkiella sp.]